MEIKRQGTPEISHNRGKRSRNVTNIEVMSSENKRLRSYRQHTATLSSGMTTALNNDIIESLVQSNQQSPSKQRVKLKKAAPEPKQKHKICKTGENDKLNAKLKDHLLQLTQRNLEP